MLPSSGLPATFSPQAGRRRLVAGVVLIPAPLREGVLIGLTPKLEERPQLEP